MRVLLATTNAGKVREIRAILDGSALDVYTLPMWLGHVETGPDYLANARLKAEAAVRTTGVPVLTEDAGLEVDALGGLPGHRSARFAGPAATDDVNTAKLLRLLASVPDGRRGGRYRAVAYLLLPSGRHVAGEGILEGSIASVPRGSGGFGYDPVFVPAGEDRTVAELSPQEKDAISHRARALRALLERADGAL